MSAPISRERPIRLAAPARKKHHAKALTSRGHPLLSSLTGGYHLAYIVAAACVAVGILASFLLLRPPTAPVLQEAEETVQTNTDLLGAPELAAEAA